jgi:hypothetical protein
MKSNPNARVSLIAGLLSSVLIWAAHKEGWTLESYYATLIATGVVAGVLWLGRDIWAGGLVGLFRRVWRGAGK